MEAPAQPCCDPAFLAWCAAHGLAARGVAPAFVADGWRGVAATDPIRPGDVLVAAPEALLMSGRSARRDGALGPLLRRPGYAAALSDHQVCLVWLLGWMPGPPLPFARAASSLQAQPPCNTTKQVLAVHLLHEASKGAASFWHLYIKQLPRSYTTLCCWPDAAVAALQAQHAQQAARDAIDKAQRDWRGAWPLLQDLGAGFGWGRNQGLGWQLLSLNLVPAAWWLSAHFYHQHTNPPNRPGLPKKWSCWGAWRWAASTVLSRTMHLPGDTAGALTPFGDLFNYRAPPPPFVPRLRFRGRRGARGLHIRGAGGDNDDEGALGDRAAAASEPGAEEAHGAADSPLCPATAAPAAVAPPAAVAGGSEQETLKGATTAAAEQAAAPPPASPPPPSSPPAAAGAEGLEGLQLGGSSEASSEGESDEDEPEPDGGAPTAGDGEFDESDRVYRLSARTAYAPGEQVFLCYGRHTNLEVRSPAVLILRPPLAAAAAL
jgi:hypothetical protein